MRLKGVSSASQMTPMPPSPSFCRKTYLPNIPAAGREKSPKALSAPSPKCESSGSATSASSSRPARHTTSGYKDALQLGQEEEACAISK